ncbi:uncharacterized protein LOC109855467 isoform X2 [Pseudomyrmex gracilis]|uniref:uncharacterized protein LOC109855467 isoform X2 n=1 Tax=Pseudomyrmex gracilis TaxID=219809 RepID=UPI00099531ED|nr:uncharacterized protein LOC109855467 isoform X2 [Pseudomyrmex gracilis]
MDIRYFGNCWEKIGNEDLKRNRTIRDFGNGWEKIGNEDLKKEFDKRNRTIDLSVVFGTDRSKSRSETDNHYSTVKPKCRKAGHLMNTQTKHGSRCTRVAPTPCVNCRSLQKNSNYNHQNFLDLNIVDLLRSTRSLRADHSQCSSSSLGSSADSPPGSCGDSQPGSSDESTVNQNSPRHRLNCCSPDRRFQRFESNIANTPEMFPNDQNNERQDYEKHGDLNMNFINRRIDLIFNSFGQSNDLGRTYISNLLDADVFNNKSSTKKEDKIKQQSLVCGQTTCNSSGLWDLGVVSSTNESGIEDHHSPNANTSHLIPLHSDKLHFCPQSLYCNTCSKYICEDCAALCVRNHVTVEHIEFLDTLQQQIKDVFNEGYLGIDVLTDDIKEVKIWRIRQNRRTKIRPGRENNPLLKNYRLPQSFFPYDTTDSRSKYPIPRGRPIMGYDHDINLSNRVDNQVQSTDILIIGHFGEEDAQNLCRPWGVTVDTEGNIIVSDRSNNRIQIFRGDGVLIRSFGDYGNGNCQFNKPAGIAVDAMKRIIVADKDNHRIQILTMEGAFLRKFGEYGDKDGCFNYPWDVAVNSTCEIAVTDTRNHRVQLFTAEGVFLRMFGGQSKYLDSPRGVCFNKEGNLLVTDFNYHHVLKIDYDMEQARVVRCDSELRILKGDNSKENVESAPFQRPQGIIAADDGSFLVADSRHNSIKAFNSLGHLMYVYNPGLEEINRPLGLALYTDGRIVFTDNGQNYVRLVKLTNHVNPIRRNTIMFG